MTGSGPPEVANPTDEIAPSVDPSLVEMLGGEPGLFEHILTCLVNDESTSAGRVIAGTSAIRWLQVCKQAKQLATPALWVTLLSTYYPNYPMPKFGYITTAELFKEMWFRHNKFAKAKALYERLKADFDRVAITVSGEGLGKSMRTRRLGTAVRAKWEIGESTKAALSDMHDCASSLKIWDAHTKVPAVRLQNAGMRTWSI